MMIASSFGIRACSRCCNGQTIATMKIASASFRKSAGLLPETVASLELRQQRGNAIQPRAGHLIRIVSNADPSQEQITRKIAIVSGATCPIS
jgi:hypothetical protein